MAEPKRIFVVEDEEDIRIGVLEFLDAEGHLATGIADGRQALAHLERETFDLIILDGQLPGMDGFRVLETLRARGLVTPILLLTARGSEADRLLGFHLQADDYVVKPFYMSELGARVRLLLDRGDRPEPRGQACLRSGSLVFDPFRLSVLVDGQPTGLLPREIRLLEVFLRHPGRTLSREVLVERAWEKGARPSLRAVDAHVARLRKKLPMEHDFLTTIPGEGYRWVLPVESLKG